MINEAISAARRVVFEPVTAPSPWHAFRAELPAFPLPEQLRAPLNNLFTQMSRVVSELLGLQPTLWLDTAELHKDGGARLFSSHARKWSPTMGFCFDPTGPAPRTLEFSDLMNAPYGTPPRIYDRSAIFVSNLQETTAAYRLMCGRGLSSALFFAAAVPAISAAVDRFMINSRATLEPLVASNSFKHHNFYLPLFSSASLARAAREDLLAWMGDVEIYLREVPEDKELLLLAKRDMISIFQRLGMERLSPGDASAWAVSLESTEGA
jgi:hypothetical protein